MIPSYGIRMLLMGTLPKETSYGTQPTKQNTSIKCCPKDWSTVNPHLQLHYSSSEWKPSRVDGRLQPIAFKIFI